MTKHATSIAQRGTELDELGYCRLAVKTREMTSIPCSTPEPAMRLKPVWVDHDMEEPSSRPNTPQTRQSGNMLSYMVEVFLHGDFIWFVV